MKYREEEDAYKITDEYLDDDSGFDEEEEFLVEQLKASESRIDREGWNG